MPVGTIHDQSIILGTLPVIQFLDFFKELNLFGDDNPAKEIFREINQKDEFDLEGIEPLYLQIINEMPDTEEAEISYWRLSNMYMQAYSPPRNTDAIALLEQYLLHSRRLITRQAVPPLDHNTTVLAFQRSLPL